MPEESKTDSVDQVSTLPPELRNRVYELSLPMHGAVHINPQRASGLKVGRSQVGLLRASRQIRREALPVFVCNNQLIYHLDPFIKTTVQRMCVWLSSITSVCGNNAAFNIKLAFPRGPVWTNLEAMPPLLELMRHTGQDLASERSILRYNKAIRTGSLKAPTKAAKYSIFSMDYSDGLLMTQEVLEKAVRLARRARVEGWSRDGLEKRYAEFVRTHKSVHAR